MPASQDAATTFLAPVSLSPTSQILVPQSSQQALPAITHIFTYTLQDEPKSSGVHGTTGVLRGMSVHNPPSGVPMCTHTYIHTYIDKGYIYMGGELEETISNFGTSICTCIHMYVLGGT